MGKEKKPLLPIIAAIIGALVLIAVPFVSRLIDFYFPLHPPTSTVAPAESFTGTWEGVDPTDGSTVTIFLVQTDDLLVGTLIDSFSGELKPLGYHGKGSRNISSSTTAHMVFDLTRWDSRTATWDVRLHSQIKIIV